MIKKLTPASICSQKKWAGLPISTKNKIRKTSRDADKDGVPNKYDCHPKNKRRQESFLPADQTFLDTHPNIELGEFITQGTRGQVFGVKGNRNLIVKTNKGVDDKRQDVRDRVRAFDMTAGDMEDEAELYRKNDFSKTPLIIPTKLVNLGSRGLRRGNVVGLVRPKVAPVFDFENSVPMKNIKRMSNAVLENLRQKLITLSYQGYQIRDSLQIGLDKANRPLLYDMGHFRKSSDIDATFEKNNFEWFTFLEFLGKGGAAGIQKYGEVTNGKNSIVTYWAEQKLARANESYQEFSSSGSRS